MTIEASVEEVYLDTSMPRSFDYGSKPSSHFWPGWVAQASSPIAGCLERMPGCQCLHYRGISSARKLPTGFHSSITWSVVIFMTLREAHSLRSAWPVVEPYHCSTWIGPTRRIPISASCLQRREATNLSHRPLRSLFGYLSGTITKARIARRVANFPRRMRVEGPFFRQLADSDLDLPQSK